MSKKEEIRLLNETYKNAKMASDSIHMVLPKVYDEEFAYELNYEADYFEKMEKKAQKEIQRRGAAPMGVPKLVNAMTWTSIQGKTIFNTSTSHMADMVIQGNTRGITELLKVGHGTKNAGKAALELAEELMDFEEKNIEKLKRYL